MLPPASTGCRRGLSAASSGPGISPSSSSPWATTPTSPSYSPAYSLPTSHTLSRGFGDRVEGTGCEKVLAASPRRAAGPAALDRLFDDRLGDSGLVGGADARRPGAAAHPAPGVPARSRPRGHHGLGGLREGRYRRRDAHDVSHRSPQSAGRGRADAGSEPA